MKKLIKFIFFDFSFRVLSVNFYVLIDKTAFMSKELHINKKIHINKKFTLIQKFILIKK